MTTEPVPPRHFRHDLTNALISVGIVIGLFIGAHTLSTIVGDWVLSK